MTDAEIYAKYRKRLPEGKLCPVCGKVLPLEEFGTNRNHGGNYLQSYCRECNKAVAHDRHARLYCKRKGITPPRPAWADLTMPRREIPTLEVGKRYEVIDTGKTWQGVSGGDGKPKPIIYKGPCVARWGRNWGIQTSTGIRTFTAGQLVGLTVREVA